MTQLELLQPEVEWASLHMLPQPPQLLWSVVVSTHAPHPSPAAAPQVVGSPVGQLHTPLTHEAPLTQWRPQLPQLLTSDETSTQIAEHNLSVADVPQTVHAPPWQAEFAGHAVPQPPQLAWSVLVSTHAPLHAVG
jgi:hypothetical protein